MKILCLIAFLVGAGVSAKDKESSSKENVGTVIGIDLGTTYSWWVN